MKPKVKSFWSLWEQQPSHKDELLRYLEWVPLAWGAGRIVPGLNDLLLEAGLRRHVQSFRFIGRQGPGNPHIDSPVDLIRWQQARQSDNHGTGPDWACGPMSALYVGLLAALGIYARRVWSSSMHDGQQDYGIEFWSPTLGQWVFVLPQLGVHFELRGIRQSYFRFCAADRVGSPIYPVTYLGTGKAPYAELDLGSYRGMSGNPHCMRGNFPHAGGGELSPEHWEHLQLMPKIGKAKVFPGAWSAYDSFDLGYVLGPPDIAVVNRN